VNFDEQKSAGFDESILGFVGIDEETLAERYKRFL
jgi:hypothetical protein